MERRKLEEYKDRDKISRNMCNKCKYKITKKYTPSPYKIYTQSKPTAPQILKREKATNKSPYNTNRRWSAGKCYICGGERVPWRSYSPATPRPFHSYSRLPLPPIRSILPNKGNDVNRNEGKKKLFQGLIRYNNKEFISRDQSYKDKSTQTQLVRKNNCTSTAELTNITQVTQGGTSCTNSTTSGTIYILYT